MEYTFTPVNVKSKVITLQEVIQAAVKDGGAIIPVVGDCMEGCNIVDGGLVAVDFTHYPRPGRMEDGKYIPGDPCVCYASFPGKANEPHHPPAVMCKQYDGVWIGHMVGTRYANQWAGGKYRMNRGFPAIAILGVVFASWGPDGSLLWETDPETYPTELPSKITVKSDNIDLAETLVRMGVQ